MKDLILDAETFSSVDLAKCGVYKYAASEDFEILLLAYSCLLYTSDAADD